MIDNNKQTIIDMLKPTQMVYLATSEDNQPHVRPMTLIYHLGKFYFATGSWDSKARQIASNPKVEICLTLKEESGTGYVRVIGNLDIINDLEIKKEISSVADFITYYFKEPSDPGFVLYKMNCQKAEYMQPGEQLATKFDW